ncbi:hypothetical protein CSUI_008021, partial [Cystoisospora suis]
MGPTDEQPPDKRIRVEHQAKPARKASREVAIPEPSEENARKRPVTSERVAYKGRRTASRQGEVRPPCTQQNRPDKAASEGDPTRERLVMGSVVICSYKYGVYVRSSTVRGKRLETSYSCKNRT